MVLNAKQFLIDVTEKSKREIDKGLDLSVFLTDLSKTFDCLTHDFIIVKLNADIFKHDALCFWFSYLNDRKQRIKVNANSVLFKKLLLINYKLLIFN